MPFEFDVEDKINQLEQQLSAILNEIYLTADIDEVPKNDRERLISIGEIKSEFLHLINKSISTDELDEKIKLKSNSLAELQDNYVSPEERRNTMVEALNDYIQQYIEIAREALDEYVQYISTFDYPRKVLKLRKSKSTATANITSSSDHLFLHLCLFLGMHQMILDNKAPYVLPLIIMDQPSRPYFNNKKYDYKESKESLSKKDDWYKVLQIFQLLNSFYNNVLKENQSFQIIVLEHVSVDAWDKCNNINLVEIFDGVENALIPTGTEQEN